MIGDINIQKNSENFEFSYPLPRGIWGDIIIEQHFCSYMLSATIVEMHIIETIISTQNYIRTNDS